MAETCNAPVEVKRAYAKELAPQLIKDHGKKKHYSPEQIRDSVWRAGLDVDFICWGYVLFLDQGTFDLLHQQTGESCDYVEMHTEMGHHLADAFQSSSWFPTDFDWSMFNPTHWDWPDLGDWIGGDWIDFDGPDLS